MAQWFLRKASFFAHVNGLGPRLSNDLDLKYSHTFINSISCLHLPMFKLQAAIVSEKSIVFTFSYRKAYNQIWPCRKISQGHSSVIIWTNYDGQQSPIIHTKFCVNRSTGSGKEEFWMIFTIWGHYCHLGHLTQMPRSKLSFPLPKEAPHKIRLWLAKWFQRRRCLKLLTTTDGRRTTTPDHKYNISSPMSLRLRWANNINTRTLKRHQNLTPKNNIQQRTTIILPPWNGLNII